MISTPTALGYALRYSHNFIEDKETKFLCDACCTLLKNHKPSNKFKQELLIFIRNNIVMDKL